MQAPIEGDATKSLALPHLVRGFTADHRRGPRPLPRHRHRTLWISDLHLGSRHCRAEELLELLNQVETETLYLVGDIIDEWKLRRGAPWPAAHAAVLERVAEMSRQGTRVVYVSGNHDISLRAVTVRLPGLEVTEELVHHTADGRRLLVLHGDQFDDLSDESSWLVRLGDWSYQAVMAFNLVYNRAAKSVGVSSRSISLTLKQKVKEAVKYISNFEELVAERASSEGVDGVVCGHIHKAEMREIGDVLYLNDGDWVESCTGLVEDERGRLAMYHYRDGSWRPYQVDPTRIGRGLEQLEEEEERVAVGAFAAAR